MRPLILLLTLSFCAERPAEIRVFAAASLTNVLQEIAADWEGKGGEKVVFNFGSSNTLARQIEEGAPADVFLSADEEKMDRLARLGLVAGESRFSIAGNALVVVVPKEGGREIATAEALLEAGSLAVGEPSSVPAGIYARQWMESIGVWDRVKERIVPADNARAALAAVEGGNVDAAVVFATDARISRRVRVTWRVPAEQAPQISYPFAMMASAHDPAAARRFLAHLRSRAGLDAFARHGFIVERRSGA